MPDGSTVTYNFYGPEKPSPIIYLLCPGIGNSCETCYIRAFVHQMVASSYSVAVLNHVRTLRDSPLTGNRLFTYGGTGDLAAVFEDLLSRYPSSQFVLVGFSLGANIAVRFIGERVAWRRHLLCAVSVCQGYDPNQAIRIFPNISPMSKVQSRRRDLPQAAEGPLAEAQRRHSRRARLQRIRARREQDFSAERASAVVCADAPRTGRVLHQEGTGVPVGPGDVAVDGVCGPHEDRH